MRAPPPAKWGRATQAEIKPNFKTPRAEGIPFLANFPTLDGDLTDWGRIRPLVLQQARHRPGPDEPILMYAAWNYQGFFFGYRLIQPADRFAYPKDYYGSDLTGLTFTRNIGFRWAYEGDYCRLFFDTLDGRNRVRGEPHTQEFCILPRGTEGNADLPGIERIVPTTRDGTFELYQYWEIRSVAKVFPPQPAKELGPDGSGPYRATLFEKDGYSTEIFLPRSLFNVPVFCPGWYVGFEACVGAGPQPRDGGSGLKPVPSNDGMARPKGVQVWVEDMHTRLYNTDFNQLGSPVGVVRIVGGRNGTYSAQLGVGSTEEIAGLKATPGELKTEKGETIPASAVQVACLIGEPLKELWKLGYDRGVGLSAVNQHSLAAVRYASGNPATLKPNSGQVVPEMDKLFFYDHVSQNMPQRVPCNTCQPLWLTLRVPESAAPGNYKGTLKVVAQVFQPVPEGA